MKSADYEIWINIHDSEIEILFEVWVYPPEKPNFDYPTGYATMDFNAVKSEPETDSMELIVAMYHKEIESELWERIAEANRGKPQSRNDL